MVRHKSTSSDDLWWTNHLADNTFFLPSHVDYYHEISSVDWSVFSIYPWLHTWLLMWGGPHPHCPYSSRDACSLAPANVLVNSWRLGRFLGEDLSLFPTLGWWWSFPSMPFNFHLLIMYAHWCNCIENMLIVVSGCGKLVEGNENNITRFSNAPLLF